MVTFGDYQLFLATRELKKGDEVHMLTTGEFAVLKALVQHAREPLTRDKLMNLARGREWDALERSIDVQISRLRRLIEPDPSKTALYPDGLGCRLRVRAGRQRAQGLSLRAAGAAMHRPRRLTATGVGPVRRRATGPIDENAALVPAKLLRPPLWLVLIVVLFSKALTLVYLLMNEDVIVDRQYSHGAALTIRAFWAADESRAPSPRLPACAGAEQRRPARRAALAVHGNLPAADADGAGAGHRDPPAYPPAVAALGARTEPRRRLAGGAAVSASLAWPTDLERARLVPRHRPALHRRRLDLRPPAQPAAQAPGGRRPPVRPGAQRALPLGPETPSEMAEVYRAFNQMAEDIEQGGRERELMLAGVSTTCAPR